MFPLATPMVPANLAFFNYLPASTLFSDQIAIQTEIFLQNQCFFNSNDQTMACFFPSLESFDLSTHETLKEIGKDSDTEEVRVSASQNEIAKSAFRYFGHQNPKTQPENMSFCVSGRLDQKNSDEISGNKKQRIKKNKSETKNLIKNYGRAILTFIIKNQRLRQRVTSQFGVADGKFLEAVYSFRDHIHTISAIRYIWQHHPYANIFRILSCEYLRKHNLQHIFNSRVYKHSVYLKYQQKLIKSMQNPKQFESIKEL